MAHSNQLKPNHKAIQHYYETLQTFSDQKVTHEGATETAFSRLLADTAHAHGWTLFDDPEFTRRNVIADTRASRISLRIVQFHSGLLRRVDRQQVYTVADRVMSHN
jgi:hypothetical protein